MKILVFTLALLFSASIYANSFCDEAASRGEKIMIDRQNGVPKSVMKSGVYLLGLSTEAMRGFAKGAIKDVYNMPKGDKEFRPQIIKEYKKSVKKDCNRMVFLQDSL